MKWQLIGRENGLVEWLCPHGVGHPSKKRTKPKYYYGVHGCDGCCSTPEFKKLEDESHKTRLITLIT